jgi:hypothetical protein
MFGRTIAPAATSFQDMNDAADDTSITDSLDAANIRRQMRFNPLPRSSLSQNRFLRTIPAPSKNESGSYCQGREINEF